LKAELAVGTDQRRGQDLAQRDARRQILGQPQVQVCNVNSARRS
jgi:hypothetical protein